jgi:hypothetical protein
MTAVLMNENLLINASLSQAIVKRVAYLIFNSILGIYPNILMNKYIRILPIISSIYLKVENANEKTDL